MDEATEKRGPGRPRKPEMLPIKLLVAYWPLDERGKCDAGAEIELPAEEARNLVAKGLADRNDKF